MENVPVTVDSKGRVRASKEQRRLILAEFERSGVSAARFAKRTGLKYSTLAGWLQRYRRTKPPGRARQVRLLEAVVEQAQGAGGQNPAVMVLQLHGGVRLEVADEKPGATDHQGQTDAFTLRVQPFCRKSSADEASVALHTKAVAAPDDVTAEERRSPEREM